MPKTVRTKQKNQKRNQKTCKINSIPGIDKDIQAVININAIKHNINYLRQKSKTDIMPVLKADAYGHGLVDMAKILRKLGVKHIGVATIGEAILLRKNGDKGRILSWLYDIDGQEFKDGLKHDLDIAIFDHTMIPNIKRMVPPGKTLKITMFVDTGINRAGIPYEQSLQAFIDVVACDKFELVGMMTHLICAEIKNSPIVNEQLRKFRELRTQLANIGIVPPLVHAANTGGCLNYDVSDFTLARAGSGIYGIPANFKPNKHLRLPMSVKSHIIQIKEVQKGEGIGYDWQFITPKQMKICIVPIGYADIIPRNASLKCYVYINGTKSRVLGTISMDQIVVEYREKDSLGDEVYIFGDGKNCPQTIFHLSSITNTIPLEILCRTGYRINRMYVHSLNK